MSGEPKTLTLTLEEAMRAVHWERLDDLREKHGNLADVQVEIVEDGWWVFLSDDGKRNQVKEFGSWEDAFSFALGVRVVARDDAAHLEAELSKWWSAYVEVADFLGMVSADDTGRIGAVAGMEEVLAELEQREKDAAELRAAAAAYIQALDDRKAIKSDVRNIDLFREARYRVRDTLADLRAALAATEGSNK